MLSNHRHLGLPANSQNLISYHFLLSSLESDLGRSLFTYSLLSKKNSWKAVVPFYRPIAVRHEAQKSCAIGLLQPLYRWA